MGVILYGWYIDMKIQNLNLKNFRNYNKLDISFNDKLNIIIGNNAQGKTNILEAIYYLSITKPISINNDKSIIMRDKEGTSISTVVVDKDSSNKLTVNVTNNGKKLLINSNEIKKHSDFIGKLKVILFTPDSLGIIKEGPGNRRRFLNIEISQLYVRYINILNEFNVILKQRNEYLKIIREGNYNKEYMNILNEKFISLSIDIYKYRKKFIDLLNRYIGSIFKDISSYEGLSLRYITNIDLSDMNNIEKVLMEKIDAGFNREVVYGSTLIGPHRDDFSFILEDNDLLLYGSQGQLKMAVLALKLAEIEVFKDICGENPVILLDDLFSELDINKRNKVINYLNKDMQTIITTTDLSNVDEEYINNSYIFEIENGAVIYKNYD